MNAETDPDAIQFRRHPETAAQRALRIRAEVQREFAGCATIDRQLDRMRESRED